MKPDDAVSVSRAPTGIARPLLLFWSAFVALNTLRGALLGISDPAGALLRRIGVALLGVLLSWIIARLLLSRRFAAPRSRLAVVLAASLPAGILFAAGNFLVFDVLAPLPGENCSGGPCDFHAGLRAVSDAGITWAFAFAAWGLLLDGMLSAAAARLAEAAAHRAQLEASHAREAEKVAEVRALRYQVNPHFLFNVLNSLSALVRRSQAAEAERLIADVGGFFRRTLSADIVAEHALEDEVDLQLQYLAIERHRFPDRLKVEVGLDPGTGSAIVPVMLLQPIVENSIKHGLAGVASLLTIRISAALLADNRLRIAVSDDAGQEGGHPCATGLGIGLQNVRDRLKGRFGDEADLSAQASGTGYSTVLTLPLQRSGGIA